MKPTCPDCGSEYLDQGVGGLILCHGDKCGGMFVLAKPINKQFLK